MVKLTKRLQNAVVHIFGGIVVNDYENVPHSSDVLTENYLFDFNKGQLRSNWSGNGSISIGGGSDGSTGKAPEKIVIKPIDVIDELQTVPTTLWKAMLMNPTNVSSARLHRPFRKNSNGSAKTALSIKYFYK